MTKHKTVDDSSYGGGPGMLMNSCKPPQRRHASAKVSVAQCKSYLSIPQGRTLNARRRAAAAKTSRIIWSRSL